MSDIDLPSYKHTLWHKLRGDLATLVPWFADNDLLLCPTCCRALEYDDFSVEHIIPKRALANDPPDVRTAVTLNERSGLTLLCRRPLVIKDRRIPGTGCNGWKGKHYDGFLEDVLHADFRFKRINNRHHMALFMICHLALFRKYGYQVVLSPSGLLMRQQFFHPNGFMPGVPELCQMILAGDGPRTYSDEMRAYWSEPFKISIEREKAFISVRAMSLQLPISRDPEMPLARALPYAPPRYKFRPDLTTVFS